MSERDEEWTPPCDPARGHEPEYSKSAMFLIFGVIGVVFLFFGAIIWGAVSSRIAEGERYEQFVTYCEQELGGFLLDTGRYGAQCVDKDRMILAVWHP